MPVDLLADIEPMPSQGRPRDLLAGIEPLPAPRETSTLQNIAQGVNNFAQGAGESIVNLPAQLVNLALPKNMQLETFHGGPGIDTQSTSYNLGKMGGDVATYLTGAGVANTARAAAEELPTLGKLAKYLGTRGLAPQMINQAAGGALFGAAQNPESKGQSAAIGAGLGGLGGAIGKGIESLMPANLLKSSLTPSQLLENLESAKGTTTPLGDITQSAGLKQTYENVLEKVPFSGVNDNLANIGRALVQKGNELVSKYLGDTAPSDVNEEIKKGLMKAYKTQQEGKLNLYGTLNQLADQVGLKLKLPSFQGVAKKYSNLIQDQNFLKFEPEEKALIGRLSNYLEPVKEQKSQILMPNGKPIITEVYPSLKESNILAGRLRDMSNKYRSSPSPEDRRTAGVLGELSRALKSDINSSIADSGNNALINASHEAESHYKNNFSQYLDKDIYNYIGGNKDIDTLVNTFIKTGSSTDRAGQLKKLMNVLPEETKDLVKYSYLSRALKGSQYERSIDPTALKNLWNENKLGPNQKNALMPNPIERKQMDQYAKLASMNGEALKRMENPKTGFRMPEFLATAAALLGHSVTGLIPGLVGGVAAGRGASKVLSSEKLREKIVNQLINPKQSRYGTLTNSIAQAIANRAQGGQ